MSTCIIEEETKQRMKEMKEGKRKEAALVLDLLLKWHSMTIFLQNIQQLLIYKQGCYCDRIYVDNLKVIQFVTYCHSRVVGIHFN